MESPDNSQTRRLVGKKGKNTREEGRKGEKTGEWGGETTLLIERGKRSNDRETKLWHLPQLSEATFPICFSFRHEGTHGCNVYGFAGTWNEGTVLFHVPYHLDQSQFEDHRLATAGRRRKEDGR